MKSLLKNLSIALVGLSSLWASAQDYPIKPVKILVGYVAGGSPDFVARALAQKLTDILGQPFVVEKQYFHYCLLLQEN